MRCLIFAAFLLGSLLTPTHAAEVELTRVWPGWRDAESFARISEYFSGKENTGNVKVLRTQPDTRGGYYFLVRTANAGASLPEAKFALHVITPAAPTAKTYFFPTEVVHGTAVFNLGLTGADWSDAKTSPVAWKLELLTGDGRTLATAKSFLWEKPAP